MADYIEREAAVELLSQPITMSSCLSVNECHHKIAQQRIDRYLIENIPAADVRPVKWIPVTERLPRDRQFVLVYCGDNKRIRPSDRFDVAILLGDSIFTSLGVTHWMPLPEPPKEE